MLIDLMVALLLARIDATQITAFAGLAAALVAAFKAFSVDPRAIRQAERRENIELHDKIDVLYREKRQAEDRERDALHRLAVAERRIDRLTGELDGANAQIEQLKGDVRKWRLIVGDVRGERNPPD